MSHSTKYIIKRPNSTLVLVLILAMVIAYGCTPLVEITIENQTTQELNIYYYNKEIGNVAHGEKIAIENIPLPISEHKIEARNSKGEIVYSKEFSKSELNDLDWKVVIPTSFK